MGRPLVVRLFASAREAARTGHLELPVPPAGISLGSALDQVADDRPSLAALLPHCRLARNGEYIRGRSVRLRPGDELAIHPPYSGG